MSDLLGHLVLGLVLAVLAIARNLEVGQEGIELSRSQAEFPAWNVLQTAAVCSSKKIVKRLKRPNAKSCQMPIDSISSWHRHHLHPRRGYLNERHSLGAKQQIFASFCLILGTFEAWQPGLSGCSQSHTGPPNIFGQELWSRQADLSNLPGYRKRTCEGQNAFVYSLFARTRNLYHIDFPIPKPQCFLSTVPGELRVATMICGWRRHFLPASCMYLTPHFLVRTF